MITYIATNTLNGKFYIGSTFNFERRKQEHLDSKNNYPFQNSLRKNPDKFEMESILLILLLFELFGVFLFIMALFS